MKKLLSAVFLLFVAFNINAQEKKPVLSPPATASETLKNGAVVTINYAQPAVKGRKIGSDIAPYGKIWRTGANAATQFEVSKDVKIKGSVLPAGKYALFTIPGEKEWTVIFNKTWDQWGAYKYDEKQDALRFTVKAIKAKAFAERLTFNIEKSGKVSLTWGDVLIAFDVQ